MSVVKDIVLLLNDGWRLFQGEVERSVYEKQRCPWLENKRTHPKWFFKGDKYMCIGCAKRCCLLRPEGFQLNMILLYPEKPKEQFLLSPEELLNKRKFLNVAEISYCLNISAKKVYKLIGMSELLACPDRPIRVPVEEVQDYIDRQKQL